MIQKQHKVMIHKLSPSPSIDQRKIFIQQTSFMHSDMHGYGSDYQTYNSKSEIESCVLVLTKCQNYNEDSAFQRKFVDEISARYRHLMLKEHMMKIDVVIKDDVDNVIDVID